MTSVDQSTLLILVIRDESWHWFELTFSAPTNPVQFELACVFLGRHDGVRYNSLMSTNSVIDRLMEPVGKCFTPEVARRLVSLRAESDVQARVDDLADKANSGTLTDEERSEYEQYVSFSQFVTLLQIQARNLLDHPSGTP